MNHRAATNKAIRYLEKVQLSDGSFKSLTSSTIDDFSGAYFQPATFSNSLILSCLNVVAGSEHIQESLADFILQQRSPNWSWNYVVRSTKSSFPDDLDDTACALAALHQYRPQQIDGGVLGNFARLLISAEEKPGGPYNTWLIDTNKWPAWNNVDLTVNANIGWFLAKNQVQLKGLMEYIDTAIEQGDLSSSYYTDTAAVIYFLSRWYDGSQKAMLAKLTSQALNDCSAKTNPLRLALLLSSGIHLGLRRQRLSPIVKYLLGMQNEQGSWPAIGLYLDPMRQGKKQYGGSETLSTALVLEALETYTQGSLEKSPTLAAKKRYVRIPSVAVLDANAIELVSLRQDYKNSLRAVLQHTSGKQITEIATMTARAAKREVPSSVLNHLNLASLNGWLAYTIFDDILDEEASPRQLSVATYASRAMLRHFQIALPDLPEFFSYVETVLTQMDSANHWEVLKARTMIKDRHIFTSKLTQYGMLDSLWQRSWGHSLASTGVLAALGYSLQSEQQHKLQIFFRHFLIARQLNDDAHDWEHDLAGGRISVVVSMLLNSYTQSKAMDIDLANDLNKLQVFFWKYTIVEVDQLVQEHVRIAKNAINKCNAIPDPEMFISWLTSLAKASTMALTQKQQTEKFILSYAA
jgi:hypothetical protein